MGLSFTVKGVATGVRTAPSTSTGISGFDFDLIQANHYVQPCFDDAAHRTGSVHLFQSGKTWEMRVLQAGSYKASTPLVTLFEGQSMEAFVTVTAGAMSTSAEAIAVLSDPKRYS